MLKSNPDKGNFCRAIVYISLLFLISVLIKKEYDHNDITIKFYLYECISRIC